ncbi:MAG: dynamin family protein [Methanomassiliicoccales archaeon]
MDSSGAFNGKAHWTLDSARSSMDFNEWKNSCVDVLSLMVKISEHIGGNSLVTSINSIIEDIENERFHLAVLGSFKRGKSTLINALLGSEVLVTGILPLTSVVTKLFYGKETQAKVFFENGESVDIPIDDLGIFTTEKGNPNNEKRVTEVHVYVNNEFLKQGVVLVDTPGIGSVHDGSTSSTYRFLPNIDAGIFVTGVEPPIGNEEIIFLSKMLGIIDKIFIVINKIDLIDENDIAEAIAYSNSVIADRLNRNDLEIYPVSSRLALLAFRDGDEYKLEKSGFKDFAGRLKDFLLNEKGITFARSIMRKALRTSSDLLTSIEIQLKMLQQPIDEVRGKIAWLEQEIEMIQDKISEVDHVILAKCERAERRVEKMISQQIGEKASVLLERIDDYFNNEFCKCSKKESLSKMEEFLTTSIEHEIRPILDCLEEDLQRTVQEIASSLESELEKVINEFRREIGRIFQIEIPDYQKSGFPIRKSRLYFDEVRLLDYESIIPAEIPFVLPKPLYIRTLRKRVSNAVTNEMDKYSGKLRYDYAYRLREGTKLIKSEILNRLQMTLDVMKGAIELVEMFKQKAESEKNSKLQELTGLREAVKEAIERLHFMNSEFNIGG